MRLINRVSKRSLNKYALNCYPNLATTIISSKGFCLLLIAVPAFKVPILPALSIWGGFGF